MGPDSSKPPAKRAANRAILVKSIVSQRRFLTLLVVILCLLAFKQVASAQTAQLTGIIMDTNSAVIVGAQITLTKPPWPHNWFNAGDSPVGGRD